MTEIEDCFGRRIRLTEERKKHFLETHPEFNNFNLDTIISNTLQNPQKVVLSKSDNSVELFYRYYYKTTIGDKWFCVVVKNLNIDFYIITVYFTDKIKSGEII